MFNIEFLHQIRDFEFQKIVRHFKPGAEILEIGGGTGYQARRLQEEGFRVHSIDLPDSAYSSEQVFPVQPYDGRRIPFGDAVFDVVFSSNVLEHVRNLEDFHREIKRILKPEGYCVHVLPTGTWRFWTIVTHYIEFFQKFILSLLKLLPRRISGALSEIKSRGRDFFGVVKNYLVVSRHGEEGTAFTEIYTFSVHYWLRQFRNAQFEVETSEPLGLFYTGYMVLGKRLPLSLRSRLAKIFGSSCWLYRIRAARIYEI